MSSSIPSTSTAAVELFSTSILSNHKVRSRHERYISVLSVKKIAFVYHDLASDEEAKSRWRRKARDPQIPGLLVYNEWRGTFDEFEEAVEFGELDLFLKIDPSRLQNDTSSVPSAPTISTIPSLTIVNGEKPQIPLKSNARTLSHSVKSMHRLAQPRAPSQTSLAPALPFAPSGSGSRKERDAESFLSSLGLSDLSLTEEELNEILEEGKETKTKPSSQVTEDATKSTSAGSNRSPGKYPNSLGIGTSKPAVPRTYIPSAEAGIKPLRLAKMGEDSLRSSSSTSPFRVSPSARFNASQLSSKALAAEAQASITSRSFSSIKVREAVSRGDKLEDAFDSIWATSRTSEKENIVGRENIDDLMASLGLNDVKMSEEEAEAFLLDGSIPEGLDAQGSRLGRTGSTGEKARNEAAAKDVAKRAKEKGYGSESSRRTSKASSTSLTQAEEDASHGTDQVVIAEIAKDVHNEEKESQEVKQEDIEEKVDDSLATDKMIEETVDDSLATDKMIEEMLDDVEQGTDDSSKVKGEEARADEEIVPLSTDAEKDKGQDNNVPEETGVQENGIMEKSDDAEQTLIESKTTMEHETVENLLKSTDTVIAETFDSREESNLKVEVQGPSDDLEPTLDVLDEKEAVAPEVIQATADKETLLAGLVSPSETEIEAKDAKDVSFELQEVAKDQTVDQDGKSSGVPLGEREQQTSNIPVETQDKSAEEAVPIQETNSSSLLQESTPEQTSPGITMSPPLEQPPAVSSKAITPSSSQLVSPSDQTKSPSTDSDSLSPTPVNLSLTSPRRASGDPSLTPSRRAMDLSRKTSYSSSPSEATSPLSSSRLTASSLISHGEPLKSPMSATKKFFSLKGRKGRRSSNKKSEESDSDGQVSSTAMSPSNSCDKSQKTLSMILREADEAMNGMSDDNDDALGDMHHDDGGSDDAFALELEDNDGIEVAGH